MLVEGVFLGVLRERNGDSASVLPLDEDRCRFRLAGVAGGCRGLTNDSDRGEWTINGSSLSSAAISWMLGGWWGDRLRRDAGALEGFMGGNWIRGGGGMGVRRVAGGDSTMGCGVLVRCDGGESAGCVLWSSGGAISA